LESCHAQRNQIHYQKQQKTVRVKNVKSAKSEKIQ